MSVTSVDMCVLEEERKQEEETAEQMDALHQEDVSCLEWIFCNKCGRDPFAAPAAGKKDANERAPKQRSFFAAECTHILCDKCLSKVERKTEEEIQCPICHTKQHIHPLDEQDHPEVIQMFFANPLILLANALDINKFQYERMSEKIQLFRHRTQLYKQLFEKHQKLIAEIKNLRKHAKGMEEVNQAQARQIETMAEELSSLRAQQYATQRKETSPVAPSTSLKATPVQRMHLPLQQQQQQQQQKGPSVSGADAMYRGPRSRFAASRFSPRSTTSGDGMPSALYQGHHGRLSSPRTSVRGIFPPSSAHHGSSGPATLHHAAASTTTPGSMHAAMEPVLPPGMRGPLGTSVGRRLTPNAMAGDPHRHHHPYQQRQGVPQGIESGSSSSESPWTPTDGRPQNYPVVNTTYMPQPPNATQMSLARDTTPAQYQHQQHHHQPRSMVNDALWQHGQPQQQIEGYPAQMDASSTMNNKVPHAYAYPMQDVTNQYQAPKRF